MDRLPPELLGLIADQCTHSSLKCLRLVNSEYCEVVTPLVFEHFYMGVFDESHDKLAAISKSRLAKYIKSFTLYLDRLPDWTIEEWEEAINYTADIRYWKARRLERNDPTVWRTGEIPDELPFDLPDASSSEERPAPRHYFSKWQLYHGWKEFQSLRQQQLQWHESGHGMVLKECLTMLPNLDAVICTPAYAHRPKDLQVTSPVWKRMRRKILVSLEHCATFHPTTEHSILTCGGFSRRISFLVLEALAFRASFSGAKQVSQLRLQSRQNGPFRPLTAPDWPEFNRRSTRICEGLWTLTHIDWCIGISPCYEDDSSFLARDSLLFLSGTKNLQSLSLSFYHYYDSPRLSRASSPGDAIIDAILKAEPSWPCLKHVRLSFHSSHTKLRPFFQFLSPSLRSLELMDMEVGDAGQLLAQIPEILNLNSIRLSSIWHTRQTLNLGIQCLFPRSTDADAPFERAVRSYLLRKRDKCPDLHLGF